MAFWSEDSSAGYCVQKHVQWKLDSQMFTYCYRGLFVSCLDLSCLFKLFILQDADCLQAHFSAVPELMWALGLITLCPCTTGNSEWICGTMQLMTVYIHSNTVSCTRFLVLSCLMPFVFLNFFCIIIIIFWEDKMINQETIPLLAWWKALLRTGRLTYCERSEFAKADFLITFHVSLQIFSNGEKIIVNLM